VLDALQNLRLGSLSKGEYWVKNIILHTTGRNLTKLKTLLDSKGGVHNLHKLVCGDVRSDTTRAQILQHFAEQAQLLKAQRSNPITPVCVLPCV
jgi:hypothetical protein